MSAFWFATGAASAFLLVVVIAFIAFRSSRVEVVNAAQELRSLSRAVRYVGEQAHLVVRHTSPPPAPTVTASTHASAGTFVTQIPGLRSCNLAGCRGGACGICAPPKPAKKGKSKLRRRVASDG